MSGARLSRKKFLIGAGAVLVAGVGGRTAAASALSYDEGAPGLRHRFTSLSQAMEQVRAVSRQGEVRMAGAWSWAQVLEHCAQSIVYSLSGYPQNKSPIIQLTVGRLVYAHFAHQGYMKHDLAAVIPGAPALGAGDAAQALETLEKAVALFSAHQDPLAPHFVYGTLTHAEYDRIQAFHLAEHLSEVIA